MKTQQKFVCFFLALKWGEKIKPFSKKQTKTKVTVERRENMNVCLYRQIKKKIYIRIFTSIYTVKKYIHMGTSDVLKRNGQPHTCEKERKNGLRV